MKDINVINDEIRIENDHRVNNSIALIMICFAMIEVLFVLLVYLYPKIFPYFNNGYIIFALSILMLVPAIIQWVSKKYIRWMKYVLPIMMLIMASYLDFLFSLGSFALFILSTILCAQYHSKKYCLCIVGLSIFALSINSVLIYFMANNGVYSSPFEFDFSDPIISFVNFFLVKIVLYVVFAVTSLAIMNNTRHSIENQVDYSCNLISIKSEIDTASKIQLSILPTDFDLAVDHGFFMSALMKPAKEVAGDFYDFFYKNNHLFIIAGDVSDKGLSAAMFMMNVINTIRALSENEMDIGKIITSANKIISSNNKELMFVTIWIGSIDLSTGKGEYISAGHCPAFIKDKNDHVSKLECEPQTIIGIDETIVYNSTQFTLPNGSNLLIYTDGVTDAINNKGICFGEEGLLKSFNKNGREPSCVVDTISKDISDFAEDADQFDDITIMSVYNRGFDVEKEFGYQIENTRTIVDEVNEVLKNENANIDVIDNIDSAIDDVVSNIVDYSKNSKSATFEVKYSVFAGNFIISFIDSGEAFNPLECSNPDFSDDRKVGGLGIYLYKNIMDETYYKRINDKNVLTLIKKIN